MRLALLFSLPLWACGSGTAETKPQMPAFSCDQAGDKAEQLFLETSAQKLPLHVRGEFVAASRHMVVQDCKLNPNAVARCVMGATSGYAIETECLLPLEDDGSTEHRMFGANTQSASASGNPENPLRQAASAQ